MKRRGVGKWDARCWDDRDTGAPVSEALAPHALFISLEFSSSESPSVRPRVRRSQAMAREEFRVVDEEREVTGSELGVVMKGEVGGWVGGAALSEGPPFWCYVSGRALSYAMITMRVL